VLDQFDPGGPRGAGRRAGKPYEFTQPALSRLRWPLPAGGVVGVAPAGGWWATPSVSDRGVLAGVWVLEDACQLVRRVAAVGALPRVGGCWPLRGSEAAGRACSPRACRSRGERADAVVSPAPRARSWRSPRMGRQDHPAAVSHAFHSVLMEPNARQVPRCCPDAVLPGSPLLPVVSNLTGAIARGLTDPEYWDGTSVEAVRSPTGPPCGPRRRRGGRGRTGCGAVRRAVV